MGARLATQSQTFALLLPMNGTNDESNRLREREHPGVPFPAWRKSARPTCPSGTSTRSPLAVEARLAPDGRAPFEHGRASCILHGGRRDLTPDRAALERFGLVDEHKST